MFQKYRKLIIALAIIFAIPVFVLLCCDISVRKVDENEETETETVVETVDPLDASALELFLGLGSKARINLWLLLFLPRVSSHHMCVGRQKEQRRTWSGSRLCPYSQDIPSL